MVRTDLSASQANGARSVENAGKLAGSLAADSRRLRADCFSADLGKIPHVRCLNNMFRLSSPVKLLEKNIEQQRHR